MTRLARDRAPALGSPREAKLPEFARDRLGNGLEVAVAEMNALPLVAVWLVVRSGAATDSPAKAGRASLTAEVLDEGTATRGGLELAAALEKLGASLAVSADWDRTVISLQVLSSRLPPALDLVADVVRNAAFSAEDFERKKRERLTALVQELDEPAVLASRALAARIYGRSHVYGNPASGDLASIRGLERDALVRFHHDHYRPAGSFLVVAGDVRLNGLMGEIERSLGDWGAAPAAVLPVMEPPERRPTTIGVVDRPGAPQSELRIGHAGPPRTTPDYFPLVVMNTILGGSFTSRLNTRLREQKGYTYGVRSGFAFRSGPGPFVVATAVDTAVSGDAVADVLLELGRMQEAVAVDDELERARNYLSLGLPRRFETVDGVAEHIADLLLHDLPFDYYDHYMTRVRDVTAEEVRRVSEAHLDPGHIAIVVAGDHRTVEAPLSRLGIGPVEKVGPEAFPAGGEGTRLA